MTRPAPGVAEYLRTHRLSVAAAYRRLADEALRLAEAYADDDGMPVTQEQRRQVEGRLEGVKHALVLYDATMRGASRGQR